MTTTSCVQRVAPCVVCTYTLSCSPLHIPVWTAVFPSTRVPPFPAKRSELEPGVIVELGEGWEADRGMHVSDVVVGFRVRSVIFPSWHTSIPLSCAILDCLYFTEAHDDDGNPANSSLLSLSVCSLSFSDET